MSNRSFQLQAANILESVKNQTISEDQRIALAVKLAALILTEAKATRTSEEVAQQEELAKLMNDFYGKVFVTAMTDQCFRTNNPSRIANQLIYLLNKYGIPRFLSFKHRMGMLLFKLLGGLFPQLFVPLIKQLIRKETSKVILPGEDKELQKHLRLRINEGVKLNLNHLGEAILGEKEAENRLNTYLMDLQSEDVKCISIKISTIFSQINLLSWTDTINQIAERLRILYRAAQEKNKFVNLDMEEYRDLELTVSVFIKVLDEPEFQHLYAGIALQAYLPDSFEIQKKLTDWALKRYEREAVPLKSD